MTHDGTNTLSYDNNGNLKNDGTNAYTWDRANRLTDVGNHSYIYDGLGNRVQQTVSSVVTNYLNDVQPGLTKLLKQDDASNVEHFVHAPRGIHGVDDGTDWNFYAQDGLGSVRAVVDDAGVVQSSMGYDPYGSPMAAYGEGFGFTGEQTDADGSVFLRARYYEPSLGVFSALDPFEGMTCTPMSLNGYSWVEGNPVMLTDPSGELPGLLIACVGAALLLGTVAVNPRPTYGPTSASDIFCSSECSGSWTYKRCKTDCLGRVALENIVNDGVNAKIELFTRGSNYVWQHHAFLVHWKNGERYSYSGAPSDPDNLYGPGGNWLCGAPLEVRRQSIGSNPDNDDVEYATWLGEPAGQRKGPYVLLGGAEAERADQCLKDEVANLQRFQAYGIANAGADVFSYCAANQNSNSVIFTLMRKCGIPNTDLKIGASLPGANVHLDY